MKTSAFALIVAIVAFVSAGCSGGNVNHGLLPATEVMSNPLNIEQQYFPRIHPKDILGGPPKKKVI